MLDDPIEETFERGAVEHEIERSRLVWHPLTSALCALPRQMASRAMTAGDTRSGER